jgi:hypothetical protein
MAYNDQSYGLFQGTVFLQRRTLNGAALGGFIAVGDADKMEISISQKFDDIEESQSGLRLTSAHIPVGTTLNAKLNLLNINKSNFAGALWGTDTGAVAGGTVTAELATAYNGSYVPLANPGASAATVKLAGLAGTIASINVTAGGSGYAANTVFALTITGTGGSGATANAITNSAGVITGAYVTAAGTGYPAGTTTVTVTTPGAGTGATLNPNQGATALVAGTDYTLDAANGGVQLLAASLLVPSFSNPLGVAPAGSGGTGLTSAYTYAGYTGKVEAFTTGIQYYTMRLNGLNIANGNQPVIVNAYQLALNMTKMIDFIGNKHINLELDGMLLQDTSKAAPTVTAPYSQFINIVKA